MPRSEIFRDRQDPASERAAGAADGLGRLGPPGSAREDPPSMAIGDISYYVLKPWAYGDEFFHRTIAEFVHEWSRADPATA